MQRKRKKEPIWDRKSKGSDSKKKKEKAKQTRARIGGKKIETEKEQ